MPKIKNQDLDLSNFQYDPITGIVSRITGDKAGEPFGGLTAKKYLAGSIDGKHVLVHRLAWRLHYGEWPERMLDHRNGKKHENQLENLRMATNSQNVANGHVPTSNATDYKGVWFYQGRSKPYRATISIDSKTKRIGDYMTAEQAAAAYDRRAKVEYGEFAQINGVDQGMKAPVQRKVRNKHGQIGVSRHVVRGRELWQAVVKIDGVQDYQGRYLTKEEAGIAYDLAAWEGAVFKPGVVRRRLNNWFLGIMMLNFDDELPRPQRV
jgi:hypothetical protein